MSEDKPNYDTNIRNLTRSLINDLLDEADQSGYGNTTREKLLGFLKHQAGQNTLEGITALSSYMQARAQERQAAAMESIAKTASRVAMSETTDTNAQAIVDQRESKREYLSSTYSMHSTDLSLLWALRGLLVDASIRSLSKPDRFDPYRRLTTEEIAWSLRTSPEEFWALLPKTPKGDVDYALLEEFDIIHYGGTDDRPDDWMYGG